MKCGASKNSEGNNGKTLSCNEECARLERNRKLALALNIDQSTHVEGGDHIPFSADTLNLFAKHTKWGQTQEREFRVFATSDDEKRLRFKPMKPQERAFIHALAEDFGLDSESMDPEPHRHVMIWKTPRFVAAPNKTLAEALRIRTAQRSATASANVSDNEGVSKKVKASNEVGEPYNAFVISSPRFGLTVDELRAELTGLLQPSFAITFEIEFLPNEEVVLKGIGRTLSTHDLQTTLLNIRTPLVAAVANKRYGTAELCTVDSSLNILRRESDSSSANGWSRVAAKGAGSRFAPQSAGFAGSNSFAALSGNKVTFAKKKPEKVKPKKEVIVDDWEAAELAEEQKERVNSGEEDGGVSPDVALTGESVAAEYAAADVGTAAVTDGDVPHAPEEVGAEPIKAHDWASQVEQESQ